MPHSKDLRCGAGWYDINVNHFFEWMEDRNHTEIEVSENFTPFSRAEFEYHERVLHDEIEERMNEFLDYRIFHKFRSLLDEDDRRPKDFPSAYSYIYYHLLRLCKTRPTWYSVRTYEPECSVEEEPEPEPLAQKAEAVAKEMLDKVFTSIVPEDRDIALQKANNYVKEHLIPMTRESMKALTIGDAIVRKTTISDACWIQLVHAVTAKTLKTDRYIHRSLWQKEGFFTPAYPNKSVYEHQFILKARHYEEVGRILGHSSTQYRL